jgi:hypothetical protein
MTQQDFNNEALRLVGGALAAIVLAASCNLDLGPDDITTASATAALASDLRFMVLSQAKTEGGKP